LSKTPVIKPFIFIKVLLFSLVFCGPLAYTEEKTPPDKGNSSFSQEIDLQTVLNPLSRLLPPLSREGAGTLIVQAPGERYSLQFRLLARGPEAFRLELFDPFGRPLLYLFSTAGKITLFSIPEKKEVPFNPALLGPWAIIPKIAPQELLKIFWGRVPLLPFDTHVLETDLQEKIKHFHLILTGPDRQELWMLVEPFSLMRSRITNRSTGETIEVSFSDFSEVAGQRVPRMCEIRGVSQDLSVTLRYETLVPRGEIPEESFRPPTLSGSATVGKGT